MAIARIRQSMVQGLTDNMISSNENQTTINSKNLTVKDEILEINSQQTGEGVSSGIAGIKINRGNLNAGMIIFDESDDSFKIGTENSMKSIASEEWVSDKIKNIVEDENQSMTEEEINSFIDEIFT